MEDKSHKEILKEMFLNFLNYTNNILYYKTKYNINTRFPNIPESISEGLICLILNEAGIDVIPNNKSGDLMKITGEKIECKCFTSNGPISFGPTETWSTICFLDARGYRNDYIELYYLEASSNSNQIQNICINKNELFKEFMNFYYYLWAINLTINNNLQDN